MKKSLPKIWEREGNEKIHSHNSGMGIRGYHSQEFPGMGTGMKKHNMTIKEKYLANMWREYVMIICLAQTFSTPSSSVLDNPPSSCCCNGHY